MTQKNTIANIKKELFQNLMTDLRTDVLSSFQAVNLVKSKEYEAVIGKIEAEYKTKKDNVRNQQVDEETKSSEFSKINKEYNKNKEDVMFGIDYPFSKMFNIGFDFNNATTGKSPEDFEQVFNDIKINGIGEEDKLNFLHYLSEYIDKFGIDYARLQVASPGSDAEKRFNDEIAKINPFVEPYGISKLVESDDKTMEWEKTNYGEVHNSAVAAIINVFLRKYEKDSKGKSRDELIIAPYKDLKEFCDKTLRNYYEKMMIGEISINEANLSDVNKQKFEAYKAVYQQIDKASSFIAPDNNASALDLSLDNSRLSLGRDGSPQFKAMKDQYGDFKDALAAYLSNPTEENKKQMATSLIILEKNAKDYIDYKEGQYKDGDIKGKMEEGPDGTSIFVPSNTNTKKRMNFARQLAGEVQSLKEAYGIGQEKAKERVRINSSDLEAEGVKIENRPRSKSMLTQKPKTMSIDNGVTVKQF